MTVQAAKSIHISKWRPGPRQGHLFLPRFLLYSAYSYQVCSTLLQTVSDIEHFANSHPESFKFKHKNSALWTEKGELGLKNAHMQTKEQTYSGSRGIMAKMLKVQIIVVPEIIYILFVKTTLGELHAQECDDAWGSCCLSSIHAVKRFRNDLPLFEHDRHHHQFKQRTSYFREHYERSLICESKNMFWL